MEITAEGLLRLTVFLDSAETIATYLYHPLALSTLDSMPSLPSASNLLSSKRSHLCLNYSIDKRSLQNARSSTAQADIYT